MYSCLQKVWKHSHVGVGAKAFPHFMRALVHHFALVISIYDIVIFIDGVGSTEAPRVCRSLSFLSVSRFHCAVRPMTVVEKTVSFPVP